MLAVCGEGPRVGRCGLIRAWVRACVRIYIVSIECFGYLQFYHYLTFGIYLLFKATL